MEDKLECTLCGHINPATAVLCENCQMVLNIKTIRISFGDTPSPNTPPGTSAVRNSVFLHVEGSSEPVEVKVVDGVEVVLGRYDPTNIGKVFVDLDPYGAREKGISRKHAVLIFQDGFLKLSDLDSTNATHVNGDRLTPHLPRKLRDGDIVTLGALSLTVRFE